MHNSGLGQTIKRRIHQSCCELSIPSVFLAFSIPARPIAGVRLRKRADGDGMLCWKMVWVERWKLGYWSNKKNHIIPFPTFAAIVQSHYRVQYL